jgi:hypothetical protein
MALIKWLWKPVAVPRWVVLWVALMFLASFWTTALLGPAWLARLLGW